MTAKISVAVHQIGYLTPSFAVELKIQTECKKET
jgi:hypothetical protein